MSLYAALAQGETPSMTDVEAEFSGQQTVQLKEALVTRVVESLRPIQVLRHLMQVSSCPLYSKTSVTWKKILLLLIEFFRRVQTRPVSSLKRLWKGQKRVWASDNPLSSVLQCSLVQNGEHYLADNSTCAGSELLCLLMPHKQHEHIKQTSLNYYLETNAWGVHVISKCKIKLRTHSLVKLL